MKDVEFKMRTRITPKIFPNEVIAFGEKKNQAVKGGGEITKLSDDTFLNSGNEVPIK